MNLPAERSDAAADPTEDAVMSERRQLLGLAYRLLGSVTDAEDAVQEAFSRWYTMPREQQDAIDTPGAWLTTVTSRICLDMLGSARSRRERYVGEWIPEPLPAAVWWVSDRPADAAADPADRVTLDESISMAFLVVLDSMTPAERVAFVLHDVFRYPYLEIGKIVGRTPGACRQLATSARQRIRHLQKPASATAVQAEIVRRFKQAWETNDIASLINLLDPQATAIADGGGIASAVPHPMHGGEQIAYACLDIASRLRGATLVERTVNGQPGLVAEREGVLLAVYAFRIADDLITHIWAVRNPEKLSAWTGR